MSKKQIIKQSTILVFLTIVSRVLGMFREIIKAAYLGTTAFSDAFTIAFMIPNLLRRLFAEGSMAVAFVPTFKGYIIDGNKEKIKHFLSSTFTFLSFLVSLTVIIGIIFSPELVGLTKAIKDETTFLTRIMFPYLAFVSIAAFFQGILNSSGIFAPSGFVPILFNLAVIVATIFLSPFTQNPAQAMAIGVIIGGILQTICQLPFVFKAGYHFSVTGLRTAFANPGTRKVLKLVAPTIIGMAAYQVNILVSTIIASRAGTGIVSSLQFSLRLQELLLGVFAVSLGTVILSELSGNAKKKEWKLFNDNVLFGMNLTALIMIPAMLLAFVNAEELIVLIFKYRKFSAQSVSLTTYAFIFHILGLYFIGAQRVLAPAFFAQEDTKTPTYAGLVTVAVNIIIALLLVGPMQGGGIALASTIAAFVNLCYLIVALGLKLNNSFKKTTTQFILYAVKIIFISLFAIAPIYLYKKAFYGLFASFGNRFFTLALPLVFITIAFYLLLVTVLYLSKDQQLLELRAFVRRKLKKKR